LWLTRDLGDVTRPEAAAVRVLEALTGLDRHTFVVATTAPFALGYRAFDALVRRPDWAACTLASHVWPVVLAGPPPARPLDLGDALGLAFAPVAPGARGLLLMAPVPVDELTRWLMLARAGRVFLEATVTAALPGWTGEARAACAALDVGVEVVPHTLLSRAEVADG
jgi:hypothetical protein